MIEVSDRLPHREAELMAVEARLEQHVDQLAGRDRRGLFASMRLSRAA